MHYILIYKAVDNFAEKRLAYRDEHLALVKKFNQSGDLLVAGALAEPIDGAVFIFKGETAQVANDFVIDDPYVKNGLITEWEIRQWTIAIGEI